MVSKYPNKYGLMLMVDKKDYRFIKKYKKNLDPYVEFYVNPKMFNDVAPQHISLCYFSYPEKYPKEHIKKLIPKIIKIAKKYLPIKLKVKGLMGGWELNWGFPVIMWNVVDYNNINKFHKEIINSLKEEVEHFNDPDLEFEPHVGIALGKNESIEELKTIINATKKDEEFEIQLSSLEIFFPSAPEKIFEVKNGRYK